VTSTLDYLGGHPIDIAPHSHVALSVVRNEMLRLPYWLSYYRSIGFNQFILVDNGSDDGTREFLLEQPDTFLFEATGSFGGSGFGMQWINHLLDRFCENRWILLADADELLIWPGSDRQTIKELTARLEEIGAAGLLALLIDMYSDKPFGEIGYISGRPFLASSSFFDCGPHRIVPANLFPFRQIYGGVRARLLGELKDIQFHAPTMSKVPLLRWRHGQSFRWVAHGLGAPLSLAPMRGALLHFKMFDDLPGKCAIEVSRGEHFQEAREYSALAKAIENSPNRSFFDQRYSVRYIDPNQLVGIGLMSEKGPFEF
jgi:glycosyltransferase involved in cell wall biosynthesis